MIPDITVPKMADFIFRNFNSINSIGLYNGKTGISLSLFIASGVLHDVQIEDKAYNLFQEALIYKTNDISFESGLAGIGYTLLYLIENRYIDAKFDEIFGEQYEFILKNDFYTDPVRLVSLLKIIYFLSKVKIINKKDPRIEILIKQILEGIELFLSIQFYDIEDINYINKKAHIFNIFITYLKLVDYSGYVNFSRCLMNDYATLYRKGRIISSLEAGIYLKKITEKYSIIGYKDVIQSNISNGKTSLFPNILSLREKIDMAKLIYDKESSVHTHIDNIQNEWTIQDLLKTIDEQSDPLGYSTGLGRFLIYCIDRNIELL